jgi:hypothetical protein
VPLIFQCDICSLFNARHPSSLASPVSPREQRKETSTTLARVVFKRVKNNTMSQTRRATLANPLNVSNSKNKNDKKSLAVINCCENIDDTSQLVYNYLCKGLQGGGTTNSTPSVNVPEVTTIQVETIPSDSNENNTNARQEPMIHTDSAVTPFTPIGDEDESELALLREELLQEQQTRQELAEMWRKQREESQSLQEQLAEAQRK